MSTTPAITTKGLFSIIYGTSELEPTKSALTALLGTPPHDSAYYVGWESSGIQIGLDPHGAAKGATGPVPYWAVDDLEAALTSLTDAGATVLQEPSDVGNGMKVALVRAGEGSLVGLTSS
jgi:predicted enzyme related to lactoylglutathione lyase